jgi:hypothetical protein
MRPRLAVGVTFALSALPLACGRVPLELPATANGAAGTTTTGAAEMASVGAAGTAFTGAAGTAFTGAAGDLSVGTAGTSGTFTGTAGDFSVGTAGTSGTFTGAAGATTVPLCTTGEAECLTDDSAQVCSDGVWGAAFTCSNGCTDGVCRECTPGQTACASNTQLETCTSSGVWSVPTTCAASCNNGACSTTARFVFVTSGLFQGGALGGLAGADALCQKYASLGKLPGTYRAWLSDTTGSPSTRFTQDGNPYELVDGTVVADNWMTLTSGMLLHAIDLTEVGGQQTAGTAACGGEVTVWTDTSGDGKVTDPATACGTWNDPTFNGAAWGDASQTAGWTVSCGGSLGGGFNGMPLCSLQSALYCFQQ